MSGLGEEEREGSTTKEIAVHSTKSQGATLNSCVTHHSAYHHPKSNVTFSTTFSTHSG